LAAAHGAGDAQAVLVADAGGGPEHRGVALGVRRFGDDLDDAFVVAQVDEAEAAEVAGDVGPAAQGDGLADQGFVDQAAEVGTHLVREGWEAFHSSGLRTGALAGKAVPLPSSQSVLSRRPGEPPFPLRFAGARGGRLLVGGLGVRRLGVGGFGGVAGEVALAVLLEVGLVPAAAGEAEAGGGDLALHRGRGAGGAGLRVRIREFLQAVELVAAGIAGEGVDRHGALELVQGDGTRTILGAESAYSSALAGKPAAARLSPTPPGETAMQDRSFASIIAALLLALGIVLAGWFASRGLVAIKAQDGYVVVKGSAERIVDADLLVWPLPHTVGGNDLATVQRDLARNTEAIRRFFLDAGFEEDEIVVSPPRLEDRWAYAYGDSRPPEDRKSTRLNSSHVKISY